MWLWWHWNGPQSLRERLVGDYEVAVEDGWWFG